LPLLSTALLELWQRRDGNTLTLERYRASGGVEGAVARLAEEAYGRLTADQKRLTRAIMLRLAGAGDGEALVRRRAQLSEFEVDRNEDAARVLAVLTEARLVTIAEDSVEVAHEALLREWPRLRAWLEEDAEGRRLHLQLTHAANEWEAGGREDAYLYRGPRLASALDWAQGPEVALNRRERDFLDASRASSVREVEKQRRANRQLRLLLVGALVLLAGAAVAGVIAVRQGNRAESEADRAARASRLSTARELALAADGSLRDDPQRSLLLALEALRTTRADGTVVREANEALLNAETALRPNASFNPVGGDDVAASLDGSRYVSSGFAGARGAPGLAGVWNTDSGRRIFTLARDVIATDYGPDGRRLVTAGKGSVATVWDARDGRKVRTVDGGGPLLGAEFGPNDDILATVTTDGRIRVFDLKAGRVVQNLRAWRRPTSVLRRRILGDILSFAVDGRRLATALPPGHGAVAEAWDLGSGALITTVPARNQQPVDVDLSPDGRQLAVAHQGGVLELRDVASGKVRYSKATRVHKLSDVSYSHDGRRLGLVGEDGRVRLLDARTGRELLTMKLAVAYGGPVLIEAPAPSVLTFTRDDRQLIASGMFGVIHSWRLDLADALELAQRRVKRSLTADECRQYLHGPCPARST
jgi:WD40 repeat protein